jgi:subtilisin family serine protease
VTVAVIDTGVNASLSDLRGVVLPGKNYETKGDGRTDSDREPDSHGHGTSMAITIAGQGGKNGWLGIAPKVKILPIVQHLEPDGLNQALRFAVDSGAKVISISQAAHAETYSGHCPVPVQQGIAYAADHNVVVVASAGNEGKQGNPIEYPASCAGVVAVGATGPDSKPWPDTERQPYVALAAPGSGVGLIGSDGVLYHNSWGTSISTAFTAGAVALIQSSHPELSAREVVHRLIATALPVGSAPNSATGYGIIRIIRAMTQAAPAGAPNPVYDALDKWRSSQQAAPPPVRTLPRHSAPIQHSSHSAPVAFVLALAAFVILLPVGLFLFMRRRRPVAAPPPGHFPGGPPTFGGEPYKEGASPPFGRPPGSE